MHFHCTTANGLNKEGEFKGLCVCECVCEYVCRFAYLWASPCDFEQTGLF